FESTLRDMRSGTIISSLPATGSACAVLLPCIVTCTSLPCSLVGDRSHGGRDGLEEVARRALNGSRLLARGRVRVQCAGERYSQDPLSRSWCAACKPDRRRNHTPQVIRGKRRRPVDQACQLYTVCSRTVHAGTRRVRRRIIERDL